MNLSNKLESNDRIYLDIGLLVVAEYNRGIFVVQLAERSFGGHDNKFRSIFTVWGCLVSVVFPLPGIPRTCR